MNDADRMNWRKVARDVRAQTKLDSYVELPAPTTKIHDHRYDVLWQMDGLLPPCKVKPGSPHWEPSK